MTMQELTEWLEKYGYKDVGANPSFDHYFINRHTNERVFLDSGFVYHAASPESGALLKGALEHLSVIGDYIVGWTKTSLRGTRVDVDHMPTIEVTK